jgi:ribulose bisphosphate carboxylase small subunit
MADDYIPEGYWRNAKGGLDPIASVKQTDRLEDELVRKLSSRAENLNLMLAAFKEYAFSEVAAYRALIAEEYGVKKRGDKGNVTLTSYDGRLQVQVAVNETIAFGPQLSAAKELIDNCIRRWSEDSVPQIKALIDQAFQVNKGKIDAQRVLALRRLDMGDDDEWNRAMDAIADAVRVTGSRKYVRMYRIDPETEAKTPISLDIAKL